ncbi:Transcriptional regulatory protein LnrK [subsurface metagenome]
MGRSVPGHDLAMKEISVLAVNEYWAVRDGLCELLGSEKGIVCIGTASSIQEAIKLAEDLKPSVIIVDIASHNEYPIEVTSLLRSACPNTAILLISGDKEIDHVRMCMQAGISGYLLRDGSRDELIYAVRMLGFGKTVFSIGDVSRLLYGLSTDDRETGTYSLRALHKREIEVLTLAGKGMSNKQISRELGISESTVGTHLVNVFRKLDVESRTEAVIYALRKGWLTVRDLDREVARDNTMDTS